MKKKLLLYGGLPVLLIALLYVIAYLMQTSFPILFNLFFGVAVFGGYFYLATLQFSQVIRPRDWLTNLRILIFAILIFTIITFLPSLAYQFVRLGGGESEFLRDLVNITGRISSVCILIILISIFKYKENEQGDE